MRLGLAQKDQPFTVPLIRLAQFLRQAGLLPKLLSRLVTQLHKVCLAHRMSVGAFITYPPIPQTLLSIPSGHAAAQGACARGIACTHHRRPQADIVLASAALIRTELGRLWGVLLQPPAPHQTWTRMATDCCNHSPPKSLHTSQAANQIAVCVCNHPCIPSSVLFTLILLL